MADLRTIFSPPVGQAGLPAVGRYFRLTDLIRSLSERVFEFSTLAVKNRIHAELLRLARQGRVEGATAIITTAPTHAEIASCISSHREAMTREFNHLARIGLIERRCGSLVIRDINALARLIDEMVEVSGDAAN